MIVLGYHGTSSKAYERIGSEGFRGDISKRPRWLGRGVYFFQDGLAHAKKWASFIAAKRNDSPVILEAEIDISSVIDFADRAYWGLFAEMISRIQYTGPSQIGPEVLFQHRTKEEKSEIGWNFEDDFYVDLFCDRVSEHFDVHGVRAPFIEGDPLHKNSWLFDGAHVQLCVKNPHAIKRFKIINSIDIVEKTA